MVLCETFTTGLVFARVCILVLSYICNFIHYYRPQRSCDKVMFSVKNSVHRGVSARHPQADTPLGRHPRPPRQTPQADTPQQTATAADGPHPTGMHSCLHHVMLVNVKLNVSRHNRLKSQGYRLCWSR